MEFFEPTGIESPLETLLSYTAGVMDSIVGSFIHYLYNQGMTAEEDEELAALIKDKEAHAEIEEESRAICFEHNLVATDFVHTAVESE